MEKKQYVAFSGGKDSTAMLLRMIELGERIDGIFFADTGEEWQVLYDYIKIIEKHINKKITIIKPKYDMFEGMSHIVTRGDHKGEYRGFPLAFTPCYFMRDTKLTPIEELTKDGITCIGYAKGEEYRSENKENIRTPLIEWGWSENMCAKYLDELKILNPLYTNFNRLGCKACPKQGIDSLWVIYTQHKDVWEYIRKFNQEQLRLRGEDILFVDGTFSMIEDMFKAGYKPKKIPKYACVSCKGVTRAFTEQNVLCDF